MFDLPSIPLLSFHVHAFCQNGSCTSLEAIPTDIHIVESTVHLVAATFSHVGVTMQLFVAKTGSGIFTMVFEQ